MSSEASTASTVPFGKFREKLRYPARPARRWPRPPSARRSRKTPIEVSAPARLRSRDRLVLGASHSSGKLPTLLALSHYMRQNVYYMDSIEVSPAESKSMGASGVGVLDKSVVILSFLSEGGPATLAEVVGGTGLSRPTAHRLLSALEAHRLVGAEWGRYSLGARLLGWGSRAMDLDLIEAAACARGSRGRDRGEHAALREEGDLRVWWPPSSGRAEA